MEEQSKAVQVFNFQGDQEIRTISQDGEYWFVAGDVCQALEIVNVSDAVEKLDEDEKLVSSLPISGQVRNILLVNESGLYNLIFRSRKAEAQAFRRWVTHEVLPSIRKTGTYTAPIQPILSQLPPPLWKDDWTAIRAEPLCPYPTREQVEIAIIKTVQLLQPYRPRGVDWRDLRQYSMEIQAYQRIHEAGTLLEIANSLIERNILVRDESFCYGIAPIAGQLQAPEQGE